MGKTSQEAVPSQNSASNVRIGDVIGNKTDTTAGNSLVALVKVIDGLVDTIISSTPVIVEKSAANLPQGAQTPYFTVTGKVLITQLVGTVTTEIEAQETVAKWIANPTVGADVDLCASADLTGDAVGTMLSITGTLADALVETTSGAVIAQASAIVVDAGTIDLDTDNDSSTGATSIILHYIPLSSDGAVVVYS